MARRRLSRATSASISPSSSRGESRLSHRLVERPVHNGHNLFERALAPLCTGVPGRRQLPNNSEVGQGWDEIPPTMAEIDRATPFISKRFLQASDAKASSGW